MKQVLTLLILISAISAGYSQNDCEYRISVPDELNRGRYKPDGMKYGNPYTMFNKRKSGWNLDDDLNTIRNWILTQVKDGDAFGYAAFYKDIYANAIEGKPGICGWSDQDCPYPIWVKSNAIVHLIGIKYELISGADIFTYIPDPHDSYRHSFAERANEGLRDLNPKIISCWGGEDCNIIKNKALDLIGFLQAYDLLKAAKYYPEGDGDRNDHDCSARNKLRELSRNVYEESNRVINSNLGWKRNQGIICGSALGMAAIVLNDAGVETKWVRGLLGGFIGKGFHIPHPNYSPLNWQLRADGSEEEKEDGIEDCMFKGSHWGIATDVPQTNATGDAGYAEGPDYATYMFSAFAPYMRAYANFLPETSGKYLDDPRYIEIMKWYINIGLQNGIHNPTYDNSSGSSTTLGVLGMKEWVSKSVNTGDNFDLRGDILLAMGMGEIAESKHYVSDTYINEHAGNAILKTNTSKGKYFFQFLFEKGVAIDKRANFTEINHEDDDFGSFLLAVDDEWLAIDPPYLKHPYQTYTNKLEHHNYAAFSTDEPDFVDPAVVLKSNSNVTLSYTQWKPRVLFDDINLGDIYRNVKLFTTDSNLYYILYDRFSGGEDADEDIKIAIHGNGNDDELTFFRTANTDNTLFDNEGRVCRWNHPCKEGRNTWGLLSHVAMVDFGTPSLSIVSTAVHGRAGDNIITKSKGPIEGTNSWHHGLHTKLLITQPSKTAIVQTLLYPYKCGESMPLISRTETTDYVSTLLKFKTQVDTSINNLKIYVNDSTRDYHFARYYGVALPITNPFLIQGNSAVFQTDADKAFMSRSDYYLERVGACSPSIIQFKQAELDEGTTLEYDDTVYIESSMLSTVHYQYSGKFRYGGFVYSASSTTVKFFLPDLQYGYQMQGRNNDEKNLPTTHNPYVSHNDSFKYVTIAFPAGVTYFKIEVADPCAADCYFPPMAVTINNTFLFNTGRREVLGHDLDIVQGAGNLNITNSSRMSICPDFVLVNKDSLVMGLECTPEKRWIINEDGTKQQLPSDSLKYFCDRKDLLKDRAVNQTRNTIIVNNQAGLVLDSGSVTHIGSNSTILIRPGGTLLVKAGATVIIGDSACINNRGELLADHGSYICIEEGAHMLFYKDIDSINFYYKDTLDRHIVYIAMQDGMGHIGAIAGKNPLGGRGKFTNGDNGLWAGGTCVSFCELIVKNPPYGVNNRPFGWFNLGLPRALYTSLDTLCIDEPFLIDGTPSLNESGYTITICKYDTGTKTCINTIDSIADNGDNCLAYRYLFTPRESGYYRVRLIVRNDCNLRDTFTKIVYVPYLPVAVFSAPDSICPGIGVLHANGALSKSNITKLVYRWTAEPFYDDSTDTSVLNGANLTSKDWNIDSLTSVSSDFTFPGYMFSGGMKYRVSLMVKGWCSDSIYSIIVSVPLKVRINLEQATSYENPVGPTPIKLIGSVSGATSWNWSPTTYLSPSNSLTTTATPPDSIRYILTGISASCIARDTIIITKNKVSYAGFDTNVCYGNCLVLGTNFNAAVFLGYINYASNGALASIYAAYPGLKYDKHFTGFMIKRLSLYNSTPLISTFIGIDSTRKYIQSRGWFANYFTTFVNSAASISSLNTFVTEVNNDLFIKHKLDSVNAKGKWNASIVNQIFTAYKTYYNTAQYNNIKTLWEQHPETSSIWVTRADGTDYFNLKICVTQNIISRIRVTDYTLGRVEYDEVLLSVDSIIIPSFDVLYQEDSTVYFIDETVPYSGYYRYLWVFGDGDSSTAQNPIHTFAAFDSAYRVCLSVTNSCGTYLFCDTVVVDSIGLNGFSKTDLTQEPKVSEKSNIKKAKTLLDNKETKLDNIPNPFNGETIISYSIGSTFSKADLRITDVLGRTIRDIPVHTSHGRVSFDGSLQSAGIYYVSLIADGVIVKSKTMLISR